MKLPGAFTKNNDVNVIIETPLKSRNKFTFDEETGLFKLKKAIPDGLAFPCDFGFIPNTKGEDGDPLDVVLLMDDYTFPGCLVECRVIGVIKVEERKKHEKKIRNDRFVAVPAETKDDTHITHINDLNKNRLTAITQFLGIYNFSDKEINVTGVDGPKTAIKLIAEADEMNIFGEIFGEGKDLTILQMCARAVVIFICGIILVRIAGRRSFGLREPFDNVLSILLGAILSRCVVGASPFLPTVLASLTLVLMYLLFGKLSFYSSKFGRLVKGQVKVLYENGSMNRKNMSRCMISEKDLHEGIRTSAGVESLDEIKVVYLERDGQMSVIKK